MSGPDARIPVANMGSAFRGALDAAGLLGADQCVPSWVYSMARAAWRRAQEVGEEGDMDRLTAELILRASTPEVAASCRALLSARHDSAALDAYLRTIWPAG